jgi:hypothetical protein
VLQANGKARAQIWSLILRLPPRTNTIWHTVTRGDALAGLRCADDRPAAPGRRHVPVGVWVLNLYFLYRICNSAISCSQIDKRGLAKSLAAGLAHAAYTVDFGGFVPGGANDIPCGGQSSCRVCGSVGEVGTACDRMTNCNGGHNRTVLLGALVRARATGPRGCAGCMRHASLRPELRTKKVERAALRPCTTEMPAMRTVKGVHKITA